MRKLVPLLFLFSFFFISSSFAQETKRPKVGLVLSGGGAKGLAHIGVLKALDEAGVKVDYIGGTSMGGIIGGLYAIGYSPDTLMELVCDQNWEMLLSDKVPLREIPIEEKLYDNRYFFSFPVQKEGLGLPKGLVIGQNIDVLLRRLTSPVYDQKDFSKFHIPFLAIATNIVDGSAVVMKKGDLAEALRATMSIPSFFVPVDYRGNYVVDGGVVDNYPVAEVKKMGADFIIGVDVQSPLYNRDELNSLVKVISQTNSFYNQRTFEENIKLTDIYIKPNIKGYDMLSFEASDTLVQRGIEAGKKALPKLKRLVDSLNNIYPEKAEYINTTPLDSVFVKAVIVKGLGRVPEKLITSNLNISSNSWVKLDDIESSINHLYASGFFLQVKYRLINAGQGVVVEVSVKENKTGVIGVGIHYDSYYDVSILGTLKYKNLGLKGTNLYVNAALGKYPMLRALYFLDRGRKPGFGVQTKMYGFELPYYEEHRKLSTFTVRDLQFDILGQFTLQERYSLGWRVGYEGVLTKSLVGAGSSSKTQTFLSAEIYHNVLTFNDTYFPTKGIYLDLRLKYVNALGNDTRSLYGDYNFSPDSYLFTTKFRSAISFSNRLTVLPEAYGGFSLANTTTPFQEMFYLSPGYSHYFDNAFNFYGLDFMQEYGRFAIAGSLSIRQRLLKKNYVEANFSLGGVADLFKNTLRGDNIGFGYGLTYAYDSYIGPIRVNLSNSNKVKTPILYVSLGYVF